MAAMPFCIQKRKLRRFPAPLCTDHIVRDWQRACDEICHACFNLKCFVRALRRDPNGDLDPLLIPCFIQQWYDKEASDEV